MKRATAFYCMIGTGVLIGLITACGPATSGAQPAPTTTTTATATKVLITTTKLDPAKLVPANIHFANGGCPAEPKLAPAEFTASCDSSILVRQASWLEWDSSRAIGSGSVGFDNCEPNCATAKFTYYPVTMQFTTPVPGPCGTTWGDEAFIFLTKPPADLTVTQRNGRPAMVMTRKPTDSC